MDLKDFREQPDEGLFEKIALRVRRRRLMRVGGGAAAVVVVAAVLCVVLWPAAEKSEPVAGVQVAQLQPSLTSVTSFPEAEAMTAAIQIDAEATPAVEPATMPATLAKEETDVRTNKAEVEGDMAALVPSYTHEATHLTLPSEPQQEVKWICPNDGAAIVESEPSEERNEPTASSDNNTAVKAGEQPLHEDNLFWAPNIIVPNSDNDNNDNIRTFSIKFTSAVTQFQITIFNRGGRQVFHSSDPSFVWDGTFKGTALSQGAYVWVMKFRDSSGKPRVERGTVTIVR